MRYGHEGDVSDVSEAIELCREALALCPPGHHTRAASLINLSRSLRLRYEHEGTLSDLSESIELCREALEHRPPGHSNRVPALILLAENPRIRYERESRLPDLAEAIGQFREALDLRPPGHPERSSCLTDLSTTLMLRYERDRSMTDLSEATALCREALDLGLSLPGVGILANSLRLRYEREKDLSDLNRAIGHFREALNLCPAGHQSRALNLCNLSSALMSRYCCEGSPSDLSEATEHYRAALDLRPPGHPGRTQSLCLLSWALLRTLIRNNEAPNRDDRQTLVEDIFEMLRGAVDSTNCPPLDRLRATWQWIGTARELAHNSTLDACRAALDQLDIALANSNTLENKHTLASSRELVRYHNLGVQAASWAVHEGQMALAVELLERSRNLLFAQIGRYRVELEELRLVDKELVGRFSELSKLLDASVVSNQPILYGKTTLKDPTERYRRISSDWNQAVDDIRAVEGFEDFLKPPNYAALQGAAAEGPVIMVIVAHDRSDALVICQERDTPHHVELPEAGRYNLVELVNKLFPAVLSEDGFATEKTVKSILRSLWDLVVAPIVDALENELHIPLHSRIWWCPTSVLSYLPLHAAGRYTFRHPNQNLPDKYVSSYTPTLQVLLRSRRNRTVSKGEKMLIVAQPDTPGHSRLPKAQLEAELVKSLAEVKMAAKLLSSEGGTHAAVFEGMANHSWLHFTCHGNQDPINPLQSCFYLHDGRITLHDILKHGLPDAKFAFLAACHTATGDEKLLDEGLHLAAGLQFAGFKSVVGTMYEVADIDGPVIAEAFYKALQEGGSEEDGMDCSRAAYALSKAVKQLRDNGVPVNRWMRFIHIGA